MKYNNNNEKYQSNPHCRGKRINNRHVLTEYSKPMVFYRFQVGFDS